MGVRKKVTVFLVLLLVILTTACRTQEESESPLDTDTIKIAYLPITHSVPLFVQKEMLLESDLPFDIELVKFSSWPELVDAVRLNKVDGASMLFELAIKAAEGNDNLKMLSLSHRDGNVLTVANHIDSMQDLIGEKIAIPHKVSPHNTLLQVLLEQEGMTIEDIEVVEMAPAEMPFSLAAKAVAGYLVAEPFGAISVVHETGKVLKHSNEIAPDSICCVMVFGSEYINKHPVYVQQFLDSFHAAADRTELKDEFVVNAFKKYSSAESSVLKQSLEWISYQNLTLGKDEYENAVDLIRKFKVLSEIPEFEDFIFQ